MNSERLSKEKKPKKKLFYNFCYDFVKATGAIPVLIWLRPKIHHPYGKTKIKDATLIIANHRSYIDPISIHAAFPFKRLHCLATKELYNTKVKAAFFNKMHCIMVDKDNFTVSAFHDVVSRLEEGRTVVIFPEGRINSSDDNTILAFKSGAALMAHKSGACILPVYIAKRDKWYRRQHIVIGEKFFIESEGKMLSLEQLNEVSEMLRQKEIALREYFETLPVYKKISNNIKTEEITCNERKQNEDVEQTV